MGGRQPAHSVIERMLSAEWRNTGVTLFLALLASVPFKGQHQQLYDAITQTSLELPDEVPMRLTAA